MFIQAVFLQIVLQSTSQKTGNTEHQLPFYCNFDFTCMVSAHVQTLNEYLDKEIQSTYIPNNQVRV